MVGAYESLCFYYTELFDEYHFVYNYGVCCSAENNSLLFVETSAKDSNNVATAFQNMLTGIANVCVHIIS